MANKYILEPTYIYAKYTNSRTKHIKLDKILEVPVENKTHTRRKDVKTFDGAELLKAWPKYADSRAPELVIYNFSQTTFGFCLFIYFFCALLLFSFRSKSLTIHILIDLFKTKSIIFFFILLFISQITYKTN